ncbi:MAG TPA: circularly permuted type 2 ATP-grasp protein, partial [Acidimicrobiales bacterium]|nr:circularly permuted type 2 ATP-grasp protein [Acidimicrobiales bacterium]
KPVDGSGGYGLVIGPQASDVQLARLAQEVKAHPRGWIAQDIVELSTSPTYTGEGFEPRHIDLRPFAVNDGERVWVVPGGLTRVALPRGSLVVNSSQGGGSKDTWALTPTGEARERLVASARLDFDRMSGRHSMRAPDLGPIAGISEQQQQQQQQPARRARAVKPRPAQEPRGEQEEPSC